MHPLQIDYDVLKRDSVIDRTYTYEDLEDAMRHYKVIRDSLSMGREVFFGEDGEAFDFELGITISPPYIINVKILLA